MNQPTVVQFSSWRLAFLGYLLTGAAVASIEGYDHYLSLKNNRPGASLALEAILVAIVGIGLTTAFAPRISFCYLGNLIVAVVGIAPDVVMETRGSKPGLAVALLVFGSLTRMIGGLILSTIVIALVRPWRVDVAPGGACQKCGYLLKNLIVPRCPECGESFDRRLLVSGSDGGDSDDD